MAQALAQAMQRPEVQKQMQEMQSFMTNQSVQQRLAQLKARTGKQLQPARTNCLRQCAHQHNGMHASAKWLSPLLAPSAA